MFIRLLGDRLAPFPRPPCFRVGRASSEFYLIEREIQTMVELADERETQLQGLVDSVAAKENSNLSLSFIFLFGNDIGRCFF